MTTASPVGSARAPHKGDYVHHDKTVARDLIDPAKTDADVTLSKRLLDIGVLAMLAAMAAVLALTPMTPPQIALGAGASLGVAAVWAVIRRRAAPSAAEFGVRTLSFAALGFCATLAAPWLAVLQALLHPMLWFAGDRRHGLIGSSVVCAAAAVGWIIGRPHDWLAAVLTQLGVWIFSLWLGSWFGSIDRLSVERQRLIEALQESRDQVSTLAAEKGAQRERDRIARDIHDTIAQDLAGVVMLLEGARAASGAAAAAGLERAEQAARRSLADARALVAGEIAIDVAGRGLAASLQDVAQRFGREHSMNVQTRIAAVPIERETQVVLVRSLQEALSNVRRHARASSVEVRLEGSEEAATLVIDDDGIGISSEPSPTPGFGLAGMARRAALVGGSVTVSTSPAGGTRVSVAVPIMVSQETS